MKLFLVIEHNRIKLFNKDTLTSSRRHIWQKTTNHPVFFPRRLQKWKTSQKSSSFLKHIKAIIYRCLTITDVTAGSCKSFEDACLQRCSLGCGSFNQELPGLKWISSWPWLWHLLAVGPVGLSSSSVICDFLPAPTPT